MKTTEFNEAITAFKDEVIDKVTHAFESAGRARPCVLLAIPREGRVCEVKVIAGFDELMALGMKDMVAKTLRNIIKEQKPSAVAFVTEMWYLKIDTKDDKAVARAQNYIESGGAVSEHPDKAEGLLINIETFNMEYSMLYDIIRDDEENPTLQLNEEPSWQDKTSAERRGPMQDLLQESYIDLEDDKLDLAN